MKKELAIKYDASKVEEGKYQYWLDSGCFSKHDQTKPPFTIVIPPPNVTGKLHLGHAWDTTLQDMIIRYKKLQGYDTLYLPGMDHAGIATQAKVEEKLRKKNLSRHQLGREKFLEVAWEWKEEYASHIRKQWGKLGLSLDYTRERFTLDEGLNHAVNEVFVTLYNKGLIYQGERIINYDPVQKTALSNIEVIYKEVESSLYYFKYCLENNPSEYLEVATTRPETMFADVCLVINPNDERYRKYHGKSVINPSNNEIIPIIFDEYVDITFGTGVMKCTPAHDPNDFILGEKYGFPKPKCMNDDGTINQLGHKYQNLDRFEARKRLVEDLRKANLLVKIEKHINQVGHSERSDAIVEPYLSKQWFVKMRPLADQALKMQKTKGKVNFYPARFEKVFASWMEGIEDWCISRQLWWGHRIPAYYHKTTGEIYVGINPPLDSENYRQDEDVLDTWFSSALWPFSSLGWPETTKDLKRYYPTNTLVTGYDIIFFWVSRMIFQAKEFTKKRPFNDVLIHGLIRDAEGRKMSKSLGNGVDPNDVIEKYGADTLRYFLTTNSTPGLDLRYIEDKVEASWNFINKIWNASRFVNFNLGLDFKPETIDLSIAQVCDLWILDKLNQTIKLVNEYMDKYEFGIVGNYLYNFIWDDFCSWYIELSKISLKVEDEKIVKNTKNILFYVLDAIIKLIHPFVPFVSEEIYHSLHDTDTSIMETTYPQVNEEYNLKDEDQVMEAIISIIKAIRNIKNEENIAPSRLVDVYLTITKPSLFEKLNASSIYLKKFGNIENLYFNQDRKNLEGKTVILKDIELFVVLEKLIDKKEQLELLNKEKVKLESEITRCLNMLNNPSFIAKAPQAKIDEEKAKLEDYQSRLAKVIQLLNQ